VELGRDTFAIPGDVILVWPLRFVRDDTKAVVDAAIELILKVRQHWVIGLALDLDTARLQTIDQPTHRDGFDFADRGHFVL
jgi:hypothetical protein